MLVIKNARIFTAADTELDKGDIAIENGKIAEVGEHIEVRPGDETIDAAGLFAMPGIVDAHSHIGGFAGDEQDLNEMTANATHSMEA